MTDCEQYEKDAKWYKCLHCPYKTIKNSNIKKHVKSQHFHLNTITWYQCNKCSFKTKYQDILQTHVDASRLNGQCDKDAKLYKCQHCPYVTRDYLNFKDHVRHLCEENITWYKCGECEFKTKHMYSLRNHANMHRLKGKAITLYKCGECPFKSTELKLLRQHMIVQHKNADTVSNETIVTSDNTKPCIAHL